MASYETKRIFAQNLNRLLNSNDITQLELSNKMSVAASTVSSWCNGEKMPRMDKVEWMADFFDVPVTHLIEQYNPSKTDILDDVDFAFFGDYKKLSESNKETLRAMARILKEQEEKG